MYSSPSHVQSILHHRTFHPSDRRVRGALDGCGSQARRRRADRSALADQPSIQSRRLCRLLSLSMASRMSISRRSAGLRGKQPGVSAEANAFWENESFHNYADYAMSEEFAQALRNCARLVTATRSTVMCAESLWWRCHRRIIADYLIAAGEEVFHILGPGSHRAGASDARGPGRARWEANLSEGHAAHARPSGHERCGSPGAQTS